MPSHPSALWELPCPGMAALGGLTGPVLLTLQPSCYSVSCLSMHISHSQCRVTEDDHASVCRLAWPSPKRRQIYLRSLLWSLLTLVHSLITSHFSFDDTLCSLKCLFTYSLFPFLSLNPISTGTVSAVLPLNLFFQSILCCYGI